MQGEPDLFLESFFYAEIKEFISESAELSDMLLIVPTQKKANLLQDEFLSRRKAPAVNTVSGFLWRLTEKS